MRLPKFIAFSCCAALGAACGSAPNNLAPDPNKAVYTDLGPTKATLSGVVLDPEAFLVSAFTFDPGPNPDDAPPPALFEGVPYLVQASLPDTSVAVVDAASGATLAQSDPSSPTGAWQAAGVPASATAPVPVNFQATPPTGLIQLGDGLPSPPFAPLPPAHYFPTRTVDAVAPAQTYCLGQSALAVGDGGALAALANARGTTVGDLLDPAKTGGVLLVWAEGPSFVANLFMFPANNIKATADIGTVYALDWPFPDPSGPPPGASPMGFTAARADESPLGYFAVVLPAGNTAPVTVHLEDTVTDDEAGRPFPYADLTVQLSPGVSVARQYPAFGGPPPDPNADPEPTGPFGFFCSPPPAE